MFCGASSHTDTSTNPQLVAAAGFLQSTVVDCNTTACAAALPYTTKNALPLAPCVITASPRLDTVMVHCTVLPVLVVVGV